MSGHCQDAECCVDQPGGGCGCLCGPCADAKGFDLAGELAASEACSREAGLIVLVTGGRDYAGTGLTAEFDRLAPEIVYIVLGDARGADALAFEWAARERARRSDGLPIRRRHDAHWDRLGRRAGPERNGRMVADAVALRERTGLRVLCLAAPGDVGTDNCVRQARAAGIDVRRTA